MIYTHVSNARLRQVESPLDALVRKLGQVRVALGDGKDLLTDSGE